MKVETDLKEIRETAEKKEDENWEFRSFLKGYDIEVEELDSIVHGLFEGVYREEEFVFRLIGVIENYEVCPIVFNVYEQLKDELWHV